MSLPFSGVVSQLKIASVLTTVVAAGVAQSHYAQTAVQRGIEASPQVRAASERVRAALGRRSPVPGAGFNPEVELAPGVGFTNGNSLLSQRFDIGGVRRAETVLAQAELQSALAETQAARQARAFGVASAYYDLVRARGEAAAVAESASLAHKLVALVRQRIAVGEAPQVHVTRAQIEAARADQELVRAGGAVVSRLTTLRLLIADDAVLPDAVGSELPAEPVPPQLPTLLSQALLNRAEVARARTLVEVAEAEVGITRAHRRPSLHGAVAADFWSLDRNPFQSRNLGLQAFLSFPLLDRGSLRADEARTRALVSAAEREVEAVEQQVRVEVTRAAQDLEPRLRVAANYRTQILPQSQELLDATRRGYEAGLSTLLDVVDAQRTARLTRTEHLNALYDALRADLEVRRAAGTLAPARTGKEENAK